MEMIGGGVGDGGWMGEVDRGMEKLYCREMVKLGFVYLPYEEKDG